MPRTTTCSALPTSAGVLLRATLATVFLLAACSPADKPPQAPTQPDNAPVDSTVARSLLHRMNPHAWVGTAHNAALQLTQSMYAQRQLPGTRACEEFPIDRFVEVIPVGMAQPTSRETAEYYAAVGRSGTPCASGDATLHRAVSSFSPEGSALLASIEQAVSSTSSPGELAVALVPVVSSISRLAEPERSVLLAGAAVAQSSIEYWHANWTQFAAAVAVQYGPCMAAGGSIESCGGGLAQRAVGPGAVALRSGSCPRVDWGGLLRTMGLSDLGGAIMGGFAGFFSGGPVGAGTGAVVGGATASLGVAVSAAIRQSDCELAK